MIIRIGFGFGVFITLFYVAMLLDSKEPGGFTLRSNGAGLLDLMPIPFLAAYFGLICSFCVKRRLYKYVILALSFAPTVYLVCELYMHS